jgi:F0F1-type ATP synthase beta subunit
MRAVSASSSGKEFVSPKILGMNHIAVLKNMSNILTRSKYLPTMYSIRGQTVCFAHSLVCWWMKNKRIGV